MEVFERTTRCHDFKLTLMWRAPRTTMVDPKVSPNICILETFLVVLGACPPKRTHIHGFNPRQLLAYITRPNFVVSSVVGTFTA